MLNHKDNYRYRNELLKQYIYIATFVSFFISPVYYYLKVYPLAITLNIFFLAMLFLLASIRSSDHFVRNSRLFMLSIAILFIFGFIYGNQEIDNKYFLLLFPIASFSIRGPREGTILAFVMLAFFIVINQFFLGDLYKPYSFLFFVVAYLMISYLLYYYRFYENLNFKQINQSLENTISERTKEIHKKNLQLQQLSITDKLTSVYNRVKLDQSIEDEINRAQRYYHSFGVILLDIDHFKSINDQFGHQVGDKVLVEFAQTLQHCARKTDIIGRWGGEEFMIICTQSDKRGTMQLADKIRENTQKHEFPAVNRLTASFGVSNYIPKDSSENLIGRADEALYLAKNAGRNTVKYQ